MFIHLSAESFNFLIVKFSVYVEELDLKSFVSPFKLIDFIALLMVLLSELIILDFELLKNPNLLLYLFLLSMLISILILFVDRMGKGRIYGC
jgi:hypothetical protein